VLLAKIWCYWLKIGVIGKILILFAKRMLFAKDWYYGQKIVDISKRLVILAKDWSLTGKILVFLAKDWCNWLKIGVIG
jgi:hypothetical protein